MVARIDFVKSIGAVLQYHEKKLQLGQAECLQAFNFLKDLDRLSFRDKIWHFQRLNSLNKRALANTFHASINFHPSDHLNNQRLVGISKKFMQKIGFGNQPFLIYGHYDAGHPHIHIVSTKVKEDGMSIKMLPDWIYKMMKVNREIELEYNLIKATPQRQGEYHNMQQTQAQKLHFGRLSTSIGLENVLSTVIHQYKFTSLPELNAALKLYNVMADGGRVGSRIYQWRGLLYKILDDRGRGISVPIRASEISFKPTLNYLEKKFVENQTLRMAFGPRLKAKIDWVLAKPNQSFTDFVGALAKEGIDIMIPENKLGLAGPVIFVDHQTKSVFSGTDFDPAYTADTIKQRSKLRPMLEQDQGPRIVPSIEMKDQVDSGGDRFIEVVKKNGPKLCLIQVTDELRSPSQRSDAPSPVLNIQKRKKRRQSQSNSHKI
jgi:hypothetical protein